MADATSPPMHEGFRAWYGTVSMGEAEERLEARWEGVSTVISDADGDTVEALLRLAHASRHAPSAAVLEEIRQAFREVDDLFPMSDNDRELQILAAACLAALMEADRDAGAFAALSATTAAFGIARKPNLPMDLCAIGDANASRLANLRRQRPVISHRSDGRGSTWDFSKAATKAKEGSWDAVAEAFELAGNAARTAHERAMGALECFLRVQDEELDMLWWLTGQRSADFGCGFNAIPVNARPLVLAKELADLTKFLPGPAGVEGILSRAGLAGQSVRIVDAVTAADAQWLQALVGESPPSPLTTPLHDGIRRQLETGPGEAWTAAWAATVGVNAGYELAPLALAKLFYRERLLVVQNW